MRETVGANSSPKTRPRLAWYVALLSALALLATACADGANESGAASEAESSADIAAAADDGSSPAKEDSQGGAPTVMLTIADHLPESHVGSEEGATYFMDRVTELTDGAVEWEYFPNGQLGSAADMLSLVESGTTDIGLISPTHFDARMPLSGIFALPGLFVSAEQATDAYVSVLETEDSELRSTDFTDNDLVPLVHVVLDPYQITSTQPVQSVEDLEGLLVRSGTAAQEILLQQVGAEPVSITAPETYEALERGTLQATLFPVGTIESYGLQEVAPYTTRNAPTGAAILGYSMRAATFESLDGTVQDALLQAGADTSAHLARAFDQESQAAAERLSAMKWYEFSEEQLSNWQEVAKPVWDEWIAELESRGLPGQAVLDQIVAHLG